jgi:hypothetical protein
MQIDFDVLRKSHPIESLTMLTDSTGADQIYCSARFLAQLQRSSEGRPLLDPIENDYLINEYAIGIYEGMNDRISQMSAVKSEESLFCFMQSRIGNHKVDGHRNGSIEFKRGYEYGFHGVPVDAYRTIKNRAATNLRDGRLELRPDYICS